MDLIDRIACIFERHAAAAATRSPQGSITLLEHSMQCARNAEWTGAEAPQVAAAFLHDFGSLLPPAPDAHPDDDVHELRALPMLRGAFGPAVLEPIRLHVQARRYLVAVDPSYRLLLSYGARRALAQQGGPMTRQEVERFDALPFAREAVALRRCDDLAMQRPRLPLSLQRFVDVLRSVEERPFADARLEIRAVAA